jgi:hypothetical protein
VLFTNGPQLFDNTYQRYLVKFFRDRLPFHEVPIKLHLRAKKRGEVLADTNTGDTAVDAPDKAKAKKDDGPDLSKLKFKSQVSDEELEREAKKAFDSELWRDL